MIIIYNVINLYLALLFTIIIEISISILLNVRIKNDILNIVFINIVTNPLLNCFLLIMSSIIKSNTVIWILIIICELLVVIVEYKYFKNKLIFNKLNRLLFSFILNGFSFGIGLVVTNYL